MTDVDALFESRLQELPGLGIARDRVVLDPGIGFGKTDEHNRELLAGLGTFLRHGRPICLGVSRKGFMGRLLKRPLDQRLPGSLAVAAYAALTGTAHLLRVHDVAATRDVVRVIEWLTRGPAAAPSRIGRPTDPVFQGLGRRSRRRTDR